MSTVNNGPQIVKTSLAFVLDPSVSAGYIKTPKQISNCLLWLDANDTSTLSLSSNIVSSWSSKGTSSLTAIPQQLSNLPASNFSPLYTAGAVNGLGAIYFDGSNDYMYVGSLSALANIPGYTSFIVLSPIYLNATQVFCGLQASFSSGTYDFFAYYLSLNTLRTGFDGGGNGAISYTSRNDGQKIIISTVRSAGTSNTFVNGYQMQTNGSVNANTDAGISILGIGANTYLSGSQPYNGYVCEIIIYNRALSTTERIQVQNYLSNKWRIPLLQSSSTNVDLVNRKSLTVGSNNVPVIDKCYRLNPADSLGSPKSSNFFVTDPITYLSSIITTTITMEAWVKPNSFTFGGTNTDIGSIMIAGGNFYLSLDGNGKFNAFMYGSAGSTVSHQPSTTSVTRHAWNHVVWTFDGAYIRWYLNGVLDKTSSTTFTIGTISVGSYIGIGAESNSTYGRMLDGYVAGCKIYGRSLSSAEILQNYEQTKTEFSNLSSIVRTNLQLYLDADIYSSYVGSGTTWTDLSGNSNNATLQNSPTFISTEPKNITFNGSNQYATVTINSGLRVANITQEVWVFLSTTSDQVFIGCQYGTSSNNSFAIWVQSGAFAFGVNTGGNFYYSTISTVSTGVWYHLTHTYNGTTQLFYINGVLAATHNSAASGNITYDTNNTLLALAADWNGSGYNTGATGYVNGKMPVVRIYNTALSAAEVLQNYNSTKFRFGL